MKQKPKSARAVLTEVAQHFHKTMQSHKVLSDQERAEIVNLISRDPKNPSTQPQRVKVSVKAISPPLEKIGLLVAMNKSEASPSETTAALLKAFLGEISFQMNDPVLRKQSLKSFITLPIKFNEGRAWSAINREAQSNFEPPGDSRDTELLNSACKAFVDAVKLELQKAIKSSESKQATPKTEP